MSTCSGTFQRWWLHPFRVVLRLPWKWKSCMHRGCSTGRCFFPFLSGSLFWPWLVCRGEQVFNLFLSASGLLLWLVWGELEHVFYLELWAQNDLCSLWKQWKVMGWATTSTSGLVKPGVKCCLIITALQKDNEIMQCWHSGMGFLNGMMTSNCGLGRFLLNLLNFLRYESSRQDYALPQQIIQMYKSYWRVECIWVLKCQISWEQTILIMSFIVLEPFYG